MPFLERYGVTLYYEDFGAGFPVLLLAPGSFASSIPFWRNGGPAVDPTQTLAKDFRVIAMDQRNAGKSRALITATDGWHNFTEDHIALLDHLGIEQCHVLGACIGVSFALRLIQVQPWRVTSAVLQQPIGTLNPQPGPSTGFQAWREALTGHPEATDTVLDGYARNLYSHDFVYCVSREFVRGCETPMRILPGNDRAHPYEIAEEIARLAPNAEFDAGWTEPDKRPAVYERAREFLLAHTPVGHVPARR